MNDLSLSSSSHLSEGLSSTVSHLLERITETRNMIVAIFERTTEQVSHYGVGTAKKILAMNNNKTLLVDKVLTVLIQIKNHIQDIARAIKKGLLTHKQDIQILVHSLAECWYLLVEKLKKNTFFKNTFGRYVEEMYMMIQNIFGFVKKAY